MDTLAQNPDSNDPAAISAHLDVMSAQVLAEDHDRRGAQVKQLAAISLLPEAAQTLGYARFAAHLLGDAITWNACIGTGLDTSGGVTSIRIALDDEHFALLHPDEAIAHATRILGLAMSAKADER